MMWRKITILFFLLALLIATPVFASITNGTIDSNYKYAWGENLGWINLKPDNGGLTITDSAITGYGWSAAGGWINFAPAGGGVTNTLEGALGGNAWSSQKGWISMTGITINSSGKFAGSAGTLGSTAGRITFSCDNCDVRTDWRPASARTTTPPPSSGGGGGGGGGGGIPFVSGPGGQAVPAHIDAYNVPMKLFPAQSGTLTQNLTNQKRVILDTPSNIYSDDITFIIREETVSPTISTKVSIIGNALFNITAWDKANNPVHSFLKPIKITLNVPELLRSRSDLGVYFFDEALNTWVKIPDTIFSGDTVSFYVNHLTLFAIFSQPAGEAGPPTGQAGATELPPVIESPFPLPAELVSPAKQPGVQPPQEETPAKEVASASPAGRSEENPPLFDIKVGPGSLESKSKTKWAVIISVLIIAGIVALIYIFLKRRRNAQTNR